MNRKVGQKVGVAGTGALGSTVARALAKGIDGLTFHAASDIKPNPEFKVPYLDFAALAEQCDIIVECLPAASVPALAAEAFKRNKDIIILSSAAILLYPDILVQQRSSRSRIYVPSGALCGIDGVRALVQAGIKSARIASSKPPKGFAGAPFITNNNIDLAAIKTKTKIFSGNALEAARAFPANVNVAATLSLAGIGPEKTMVEVWADPDAKGNKHEIEVQGEFSTIRASVENVPDPANPKSSLLAAHSVISVLRGLTEPLVIL